MMKRLQRPHSLLASLLSSLAICAFFSLAHAQEPAVKEVSADAVSLNFNNAEIDAVVRAIGKISGKNFLVDPRVKGTINIVTNRPVPRAMTYSILISALRLQGYAVVEGKGVTKIVPEADAKLHGVPVSKNQASSEVSGDRIVTEVFQIQHESAAQLVQVVRPLVSPNNPVTVYPGNNSLVVTDYAQNMARIAQIIAAIDVPQGDSVLIPLQNASSIDVANTLNRLYGELAGQQQQPDPTQRVTVLAEPRSNAIMVRTENRSKLQAVRSMAAQLDRPGAAGTVRVIYMKNSDATKVAQTLRAVLSSDATSAGANTGQPNQQPQQANNSGQQGVSGNVAGGFVFADVTNNAIVVTGPDAVYNNIRRVIEQLDRRPAQIYVEALIAEVNADRAAEFGIQWQSGLPTSGKTTVFGGTNFGNSSQNILSISQKPTNAGKGMNFIVGGGSVNIPGVGDIFQLSALARFLEADTRTNILSTPSIVTLDGEEAKIVVGQNVPFVTGQYQNTGGGSTPANPFQTIERKDVGLTLRVKPQITEGGTIRMKIFQEASSLSASTVTGGVTGPVTNTRTLESNVIADEGSIIALGGLIKDEYSSTREKVPVLGDIPLLGSLFRYDTRTRNKTNLIIFLRPRIMRSAGDVNSMSQERYDFILQKQQNADDPERLLRNEDALPQLPERSLKPTTTLGILPPVTQTPSKPEAPAGAN